MLFQHRFEPASTIGAAGTLIGFPILSGGLACLVASALGANGLLRYKVPGAELMATLAFSLYLTHKELIHLTDRWSSVAAFRAIPWLALYAAASLLVAGALYRCIERPFLILRERRSLPL